MSFRLYALAGCPHCDQVAAQLASSGVPFERIEALGDPIVDTGIKMLTGNSAYPVTVAFASQQIILGNKPSEINDAINEYYYRSSSKLASDIVVPEGHDIQPTANMVSEKE